MTESARVAKMHMTKRDWEYLRLCDFEYHFDQCEAANHNPLDWLLYKHSFDSRNTAEENHQRAEKILYRQRLQKEGK